MRHTRALQFCSSNSRVLHKLEKEEFLCKLLASQFVTLCTFVLLV